MSKKEIIKKELILLKPIIGLGKMYYEYICNLRYIKRKEGNKNKRNKYFTIFFISSEWSVSQNRVFDLMFELNQTKTHTKTLSLKS